MDLTIRPATLEDVPFMAPLFNVATDGLLLYFWMTMTKPGEDPWEVGRREIGSGDTGWSWRNAWIAELSGRPAGVLNVHPMPPAPDPAARAALPAMVRPLVELEAEAAETTYVGALSVLEDERGRGVGSALLSHAERGRSQKGMSLFVLDHNLAARRLYERNGYAETARRRTVRNGWQSEATDCLLMQKA